MSFFDDRRPKVRFTFRDAYRDELAIFFAFTYKRCFSTLPAQINTKKPILQQDTHSVLFTSVASKASFFRACALEAGKV